MKKRHIKKITKDTMLEEILKNPSTAKILTKYNLPCLFCPFAVFEMSRLKIGEVAKAYGTDLKKLLSELNKARGGEKNE